MDVREEAINRMLGIIERISTKLKFAVKYFILRNCFLYNYLLYIQFNNIYSNYYSLILDLYNSSHKTRKIQKCT
jgi:hypothetical protein